MASQKAIELTARSEGLLLSGGKFDEVDEEGRSQWSALPLDSHRVLLHRGPSREAFGGLESGISVCSSDVFKAVLLGLSRGNFSGLVSVDTERGLKKLYFDRGQLVFAGSNLIDDRLGEVIYREGVINMEQMADSAVRVTRVTKFGQVLLINGILEPVELWQALKLQVWEIFKSTFLVNQVCLQIKPGASAFTALRFQKSTELLIEEAAGLGCLFKRFLLSLTLDSELILEDQDSGWREPQAGTFTKDMIDLVRSSKTFRNILKMSKLKDINTFWCLFELVNKGYCSISQPVEVPDVNVFEDAILVMKIDNYHALLMQAREAFSSENINFPGEQLGKFIEELGDSMFRLNTTASGQIPDSCAEGLKALWRENERIRDSLIQELDSLVAFLLQLVLDLLPRDRGMQVKNSFLEIPA